MVTARIPRVKVMDSKIITKFLRRTREPMAMIKVPIRDATVRGTNGTKKRLINIRT